MLTFVYVAEQKQLSKPVPPAPKHISSLIRDDDDPQRYFYVPFVRPGQDKGRGWWYAHCDGQYITRQLELHADRSTSTACWENGLEMCELTLEETGLTCKEYAEILDHKFKLEWTRHGGVPYIRLVTKASHK